MNFLLFQDFNGLFSVIGLINLIAVLSEIYLNGLHYLSVVITYKYIFHCLSPGFDPVLFADTVNRHPVDLQLHPVPHYIQALIPRELMHRGTGNFILKQNNFKRYRGNI